MSLNIVYRGCIFVLCGFSILNVVPLNLELQKLYFCEVINLIVVPWLDMTLNFGTSHLCNSTHLLVPVGSTPGHSTKCGVKLL